MFLLRTCVLLYLNCMVVVNMALLGCWGLQQPMWPILPHVCNWYDVPVISLIVCQLCMESLISAVSNVASIRSTRRGLYSDSAVFIPSFFAWLMGTVIVLASFRSLALDQKRMRLVGTFWFESPSVLWCCWLGHRKDIRPVKCHVSWRIKILFCRSRNRVMQVHLEKQLLKREVVIMISLSFLHCTAPDIAVFDCVCRLYMSASDGPSGCCKHFRKCK